MEFGLSSDQVLLQDSVSRCLDSVAPLKRVQQFVDDLEPRASDVEAALAELGIFGMLVDEAHDGLELSMLDAALVSEMLGSRVAPVPFITTVALVPAALRAAGSEQQRDEWLPRIAAAKTTFGAALSEVVGSRESAHVTGDGRSLNGQALFVTDFEADHFLVADSENRLYLVDGKAAGLSRTTLTTVDKTRRFGELRFQNVTADLLPGSEDQDLCRRILDAGRVLLAAETLGAAQRMLDRAVAYAGERVQFGRKIGSFQAVKHMCADMAAALEPCRAMVWYAAYALESIPEEARLTACHTKAHLSEVATQVARTATEVHGGIGFTDELGLHLWFKRIGVNRQCWGGPTKLREEAAELQQLA